VISNMVKSLKVFGDCYTVFKQQLISTSNLTGSGGKRLKSFAHLQSLLTFANDHDGFVCIVMIVIDCSA